MNDQRRQQWRASGIAARHPWYLLLLPFFVVLHVFNDYHRLIDFRFVWKDALLLFAIPASAWLVSSLLLRNRTRGALWTLPFTLLFLFGGVFKDWISGLRSGVLASYAFWLPVAAIGLTLIFIRLRRSTIRSSRWLLFGNALAALWLFMEGARFVVGQHRNDLGDPAKALTSNYRPSTTNEKPDIFYLLFDGYTSLSRQKALGRNTNATDSFLRKEGFVVDSAATSNFNFTAFSLGAVFNLDTLHNIDTGRLYFDWDYLPAVYTVHRSEWPHLLRKEGYRFENYSVFNFEGAPTKLPEFDIWFEALLFRQYNFFDRLNRDIGWHLPAALRIRTAPAEADFAAGRARQLDFLQQQLPQIARSSTDTPRFVYAHYLVPHGPFSYDSSGQFRSKPAPDTSIKAYLDQTAWCDQLMAQAVRTIKQQADPGRPLVIIIQGDHGLRFRDPQNRHWSFDALSAVYSSDGRWPQTTGGSHVNTFRMLSNIYFGKNYPLLPAKSWFLRDQ